MEPYAETEDQSTLRKFARDVAERELAPRASHWDETEEFPHASLDALREAGLFGVTTGVDADDLDMSGFGVEELGFAGLDALDDPKPGQGGGL